MYLECRITWSLFAQGLILKVQANGSLEEDLGNGKSVDKVMEQEVNILLCVTAYNLLQSVLVDEMGRCGASTVFYVWGPAAVSQKNLSW